MLQDDAINPGDDYDSKQNQQYDFERASPTETGMKQDEGDTEDAEPEMTAQPELSTAELCGRKRFSNGFRIFAKKHKFLPIM